MSHELREPINLPGPTQEEEAQGGAAGWQKEVQFELSQVYFESSALRPRSRAHTHCGSHVAANTRRGGAASMGKFNAEVNMFLLVAESQNGNIYTELV